MMKKLISDDEQMDILADLIALRTVDDNESDLVHYVADLLAQHGIQAQLVGDNQRRLNLVAEVGDVTVPGLGFAGHADVVHEGKAEAWTNDPFVLTEKNGKLFGRGVTDMKGAIVAMLTALIRLQHDEDFRGHVRLLIMMNEEKQQAGAQFLSDAGYVDDLTGILIGEPTGVRADYLDDYLHAGGVKLIGEDADEVVVMVQAKRQTEQHFVIFAHKGFLTYRVIAHGKSAHSSRPASGIDAIAQLVRYYNAETALYEQLTTDNPILGHTIRGANMFHGGVQPNSIAGEAILTELTRIIPEITPDELIAHLQEIVDTINRDDSKGARLELEIINAGPAMLSPRDSKLVKISQVTAKAGFKAEQILPTISVSMGTDATRFLNRNPELAIAIVGPGNDTAHQIDENLDKKTFLATADYYYQIAKEYF